MESIQYKVIKTDAQYNKYCNRLEILVDSRKKTKAIKEEIELLSLLIEKYDEQHNSFEDANPVEILKHLMKEHKMKSVELAKLLTVSEGLISDILNYKKGISKEIIRKLSIHFKVSQEAFNRHYILKNVDVVTMKSNNVPTKKKEMSMA